MDFGIIYQLKIKKFWWLDTIFYFVAALLLATIICFVIFTVKISFQERKLKEIDNNIIVNTGTTQQRELEKEVFEYQRKIDNFAIILANHKIPTNIFKFFEKITLPNVWFNNFIIMAQTAGIQISGETESTTALSRQLSIFEENKFIKDISDLTFEPTETGKIRFNLNISLSPDIFFSTTLNDLIQPVEILETTSPSTSLFLNIKNIF